MYTALTIAGSDSGGGAGIQADLKTMAAHHVYGMSAVTALTAQNTTGVRSIFTVTPEFLGDQLDAVFTDLRPDAVKTGMIPDAEQIQVIVDRLSFYRAENLVVDPVMLSTSGSKLIHADALEIMKQKLFPLASVMTPNIPEAEVLTGIRISAPNEMERAARQLYETYGCGVLLKGGHCIGDANDLFCSENGFCWFYAERIENPNTHGTGCTLSSAIACSLALGLDPESAVKAAKEYLTQAIEAGLDLGAGNGPLDHMFFL